MTAIRKCLARFVADRQAATAIEYAIIAAGVGAAIVGTVTLTGTSVQTMWTAVKDALG